MLLQIANQKIILAFAAGGAFYHVQLRLVAWFVLKLRVRTFAWLICQAETAGDSNL